MYDTMSSSQSNSKFSKSSLFLKKKNHSLVGQRARFQSMRMQMYCEDFDSGAAGCAFTAEDVFQAGADPGKNNTGRATHSPQKQLEQLGFKQSVSAQCDINKAQSEASKKPQYSLSRVATEEEQQASCSYSTAAVGIVSQIIYFKRV